MRAFNEYLDDGTVKKQSPNKDRSASLVREADSKKAFLESVINNVPKEDYYPNFVVETCYDIVLELIRARMFLDGLKSDSHEAEVSYMDVLGFSTGDARFLDELRYFRNGIKYYGRMMDMDYAANVLKFLSNVYPKLKTMFS